MGQSGKSKFHDQTQHIPATLDTNFYFNKTVLIFWTRFAQKLSSVQNKKSEHHH